ncbi:porin family protein [Geomonas subterranea]|uniref:Porin family protein n=1 Tax=Geomonas subterranea TaxID=2847989 RepID=A0ABX8LMZ0_9BACT|nr:OmpW family outer membrane protein [Geomonas subterranea]QXE92296.1 porin family protein [Geomonas subterranea]QXM09605.1 porin family protein [Geomonas subterranea]
MRRVIFLMVFISTLTAGPAIAADIDGRIGLTGKVGFLMPVQDDFITGVDDTNTGLAAGGGVIYGIGKNVAAELDITHAPTLNVQAAGGKVGEATLTDISLGLQYRFTPEQPLVPYLGAGVDFIKGKFKNLGDRRYGLEWTTGGHVSAGIDYFATRGIALTAELKGIFAPAGNIKTTPQEYNPNSFVGTVGIRLFLPEKILD